MGQDFHSFCSFFKWSSRINVENSNTCLDPVPVFFDNMNCLLGFFPGFGGMAEDEKRIGNNIQLIAPLYSAVKVLDVNFFIYYFISNTFGSSFKSKREVKKA